MTPVRVRVLGSGDAFGSGGRLNTCLLIEAAGTCLLVDCGATALAALRRLGVAPERVDAVVLTHFHGDHFAGVPLLLLYGRHVARNPGGLLVAGPPGVERRALDALDLLYEGSREGVAEALARDGYARFVEYTPGVPLALGPATVTAVAVRHSSRLACHGVRLEVGGRTIACSGDTEWTEALVPLARGSDLFVVECSAWTGAAPGHLSFDTLRAQRDRLQATRVVLTHMGADVLARLDEARTAGFECPADGEGYEL